MPCTAGQTIPYGPGPVYPTHKLSPLHPGLVIPPHHHSFNPYHPGPVEPPRYYEGTVSWPPSAPRLDILVGSFVIMRSLTSDGYICAPPWITFNGSTGYLTAHFKITVYSIFPNQTVVDRNWNRAVQSDTLADGHVNDGITPFVQGTEEGFVLPNFYEGKVTWPPAATAKDVVAGCQTIATVLRDHLYVSEHQIGMDGSTGYTTATFKIWFNGVFRELGNIDKVWNLAVAADTLQDGHKNLGVKPEYQDDKKPTTEDLVANGYEGTVIWPPSASKEDIQAGCDTIVQALEAKWYICDKPAITGSGSTGYTTGRFNIRFNPPHWFMHNPYDDWNAAVSQDRSKDGHQNKGLVPANNDVNNDLNPKIYEGKVAWPPTASQNDINTGCHTISQYLKDRSYECPHHMSWDPSTGYSTAKFILRFHPAHPVMNNPFTDWNLAVAADSLDDGHINEGLTLLIQDGQTSVLPPPPPPYPMNTYEGKVTWPPAATEEDINSGCEVIANVLKAKLFDVSYGITPDGSTGYKTARFLLIPDQAAKLSLETVINDWNEAVAADIEKDGHENKGLKQLITGGTPATKKTADGANGDSTKA